MLNRTQNIQPQKTANQAPDKVFNTFLVVSFILSILLPIIYYCLSIYSLSAGPRSMHSSVISAFGSFFTVGILIGSGGIMAAPVFFISGIISLIKKKKDWLKLILSSLAWILCLFVFFNLSAEIRNYRHKAFANLAVRSKPIIAAIEKYKEEHGSYPMKIQELIPLYLPETPYTGFPLYPDYEYEISPNEDWRPMKNYELRVPCPSGVINWDVFFYWPEGNYPENIYGGYVERIEDWAYVHE